MDESKLLNSNVACLMQSAGKQYYRITEAI